MNHAHFLEVSRDKLTVKYVGKGNHRNDVGSIQANKPVPTRLLLYYYEITVKDAGARGCIAVGLADKSFQLIRQPGWEPNSYGYHGDDGRKFHDSGRGEAYGPVFATEDTAGCGINFATQEIFFTKNGKFLGVAFRKVEARLIPTIGLHSPNEVVHVNFGQTPFKFDIDSMVQEIRDKKARAVSAIPLSVDVTTSLVRGYLLHFGYSSTLAALETACALQPQPHPPELHLRNRVRELVISGDVEGAVDAMAADFPSVLTRCPRVLFLLHAQRFIELIKSQEVTQAMRYGQQVLSQYMTNDSLTPEDVTHLQNVVGLLAYTDPASSSLGHLLRVSQREAVADALNEAILSQFGMRQTSHLETLLAQLVATHHQLRDESGSRGEVYRLSI